MLVGVAIKKVSDTFALNPDHKYGLEDCKISIFHRQNLVESF